MSKTRTILGVTFFEGQLVQIQDVGFVVHHFTKRGLLLRPISQKGKAEMGKAESGNPKADMLKR
jgi:hypothetical protein